MPTQQFLDDFFSTSKLPDLTTMSQFKPNCYD